MPDRIELLSRDSSEEPLLLRASEFERRFGIVFVAFAHFSRDLLKYLHASSPTHEDHGGNTKHLIISDAEQSTLDEISIIANRPNITDVDREKYLRIFLDVYESIPFNTAPTRPTVTVAPRREGMLLARELGWLPDNAYTPHLKRIPLQGDLAIGIDFLPVPPGHGCCCRIVDGAIASGATIITLMEILYHATADFEIYTVHCTQESVNALLRYARVLQKNITIYTGFVGGVLNDKFYAVTVNDPSVVIIGDVGDMIAPILETS